MESMLGWTIFVVGLLAASAVFWVPVFLLVPRIFPNRTLALWQKALLIALGAGALWYLIPVTIHLLFG